MCKRYYLLYVLLLGGLLGSCSKFKDDINVDPNKPSTASNPQLLTYAILGLASTIESPNGVLYAQHLSEKPYTDASRYTIISFDFYDVYTTYLANLQSILTSRTFVDVEGSPANQQAVARILKAYYFWFMTDRWGDIPYKEALLGKDNFTPRYDRQQDIYNDLFKELKEAALQIDNGTPVKGDILFNGDMAKWKRFANSMRVLMALRLSKADPAKGKSELTDAMNMGGFTANTDNVVYKHIAEAANENYWYNVFSVLNRRWYCISQPMVDFMRPLHDPRLPVFADKPDRVGVDYVGMPYGITGDKAQNFPSDSVSFLGARIRAQDAPSYVMTYAQLLFAYAEAAHIGWIPGGDGAAAGYYQRAVTASVGQWTGSESGAAAYLAQTGVSYDPAVALRQIGYQRWVHLYMNGYEAWAEWRRTGFPQLLPAPENGNVPIPRRQGYPVKERNINTAHYNDAVNVQPGLNGKDDLNGRIWWDR